VLQIIYVNNNISINKGNNSHTIDGMDKLPKGIIIYKMQIGKKSYSGKLVKENK
jgi:hypothetical protein